MVSPSDALSDHDIKIVKNAKIKRSTLTLFE